VIGSTTDPGNASASSFFQTPISTTCALLDATEGKAPGSAQIQECNATPHSQLRDVTPNRGVGHMTPDEVWNDRVQRWHLHGQRMKLFAPRASSSGGSSLSARSQKVAPGARPSFNCRSAVGKAVAHLPSQLPYPLQNKLTLVCCGINSQHEVNFITHVRQAFVYGAVCLCGHWVIHFNLARIEFSA
jgi:hypothetical protein